MPHAVLERYRGQECDRVGQAGDRRAFLGHLDEHLAGRPVLEQSDGGVAFLLADAELVRHRGPLIGQVAAVRLHGHPWASVRVREHLYRPRAIAIDGDALASQFVREDVHGAHLVGGGIPREVHGLRHGEVRMRLERGLHTHVPFPADLMRRDEAAFHLVRRLRPVAEQRPVRQVFHELVVSRTRRRGPPARTPTRPRAAACRRPSCGSAPARIAARCPRRPRR